MISNSDFSKKKESRDLKFYEKSPQMEGLEDAQICFKSEKIREEERSGSSRINMAYLDQSDTLVYQ